MILTGNFIKEEIDKGNINIEPFIEKHMGPNSYDVTLNKILKLYDPRTSFVHPDGYLDLKTDNPAIELEIPEEGLILRPNTLYLGCTNETTTSLNYIPMLEGRSSIGRLGINIHITAGFGDIGWGYTWDENGKPIHHAPKWTLEISVIHPVKIYSNVRIGQVFFTLPKGEITFYKGKYSTQKTAQRSKSYEDFK